MRNLVLALAATLLLTSCLRAQRGTLRGERVIITNQDVTTYPANDLLIRNDSNTPYVYLGLTDSLTPANVGMLRLNGEDFPSGLDAFTEIVGGEIDTNGILVRTTNIGSGQIQFEDTDGSGAFVTLRGFAGSGASYTMNWPGTSYSGACGGTCYIAVDDTTGQMSFTTGSGGALPVVDTTSLVYGSADATKFLRLEVDGLTTLTTRVWTAQDTDLTVAGIDVAQTFSATQTFQNIAAQTDSLYDVGASLTRFDEGFFDNLHTEELFFRRQGAGSQDFLLDNTTANNLYVRNAAGTALLRFDEVGSDIYVWRDFSPGSTSTYDLGLSTNRWAESHVNASTIYTSIVPDISGGAFIGTTSLPFASSYFENLYPGVTGGSGQLGDLTRWWDSVSASVFNVETDILPFATGVGNIGTASLRFGDAYVTNLNVSGTCTGCGGGGLPVADTTSVVEGSADDTKELRFEVDGFTTATTRVLTPQNASYTIAGTNLAQTFTATQTFQNVAFASDNTYIIGTTTVRPNVIYGYAALLGRSGVAGSLQIQSALGTGYTLAANSGGTMTVTTGAVFSGDLMPSTGATYDIGTLATPWDDINADTVLAASQITSPLYRSGASSGTTVTLACGTGQAVKNLTVVGGIVIAASCGAP